MGSEYAVEGACEALLSVLVMIAGNKLEKFAYTIFVEIGHNLFGVGLHRLESLDTGFRFFVAEQKVCFSTLLRYGM